MGLFSASFAIIVLQHFVCPSSQHGRLLEPPARNTLWRFGFKAPPNYNDNELFCGGLGGIVRNEGKCGVCGDSYDGKRLHETGNAMALNVTARNYAPGSTIDMIIEIVANHGGTFTFDMCWRDGWHIKEDELCFERLNLATPADSRPPPEVNPTATTTTTTKPIDSENADHEHESHESHDPREQEPRAGRLVMMHPSQPMRDEYQLDPAAKVGLFAMSVELPPDKSCQNCILRWHWRSANNWGRCPDKTERIGCGNQEVYRNCADISVTRNGAGIGMSQRQ